MIITVTMNPAIDKTIEIERLSPGVLHRIKKVAWDAGGKGINVSKTIRELGEKSIATGFLGGSAGKAIADSLTERGIEHDFIWLNGETRTNTKVLEDDGRMTELNEPGPKVSEAQMEELLQKLARVMPGKGRCLSYRAPFQRERTKGPMPESSVWPTKKERRCFLTRTARLSGTGFWRGRIS